MTTMAVVSPPRKGKVIEEFHINREIYKVNKINDKKEEKIENIAEKKAEKLQILEIINRGKGVAKNDDTSSCLFTAKKRIIVFIVMLIRQLMR